MSDAPDEDDDDSLPTRELLRLAGGTCVACRVPYTPHEAVFSVAMGFKTAPRCLPCLAKGFERPFEAFRTELVDYVHRRECYLRAWREADRMTDRTPLESAVVVVADEIDPNATHEWDAGDLACGELVMGLRVRLMALPSGTVYTVRATDPAAPEDLPSWCRLTGHTMVDASHPVYTIRRK